MTRLPEADITSEMNYDAASRGSSGNGDLSLETALAELMCAMESADAPEAVAAVIGKYPQHADELKAYVAGCTLLEGMVGPIRDAARGVLNPPEIPGYRIHDLFDEGGMGLIYRAHYDRVGGIVALKVMRSDRPVREEDLERFLAEAQCAFVLQHSHIIRVYDINVAHDPPYYAMELVEGKSLKDHLAESGTYAPYEAAELMLQIAKAMASAHCPETDESGETQPIVIHRDLKPGNILVDRNGHPRIIDFGLAKVYGRPDTVESGTFVGTPNYCSPEQADYRADKVGRASDVYSLGVILYEMLTGQLPLYSNNPDEMLERVRDVDPPPVTTINDDVHADLETICMRCLSKKPKDRFPNAKALAEDLKRYLRSETLDSPPFRPTNWIRQVVDFDRRTDARISQIGHSLLAFQAFYTVCIIGLQALLLADWGEPLAWLLGMGSLTLLFGILRTDDSKDFLPNNPAERLLWSIWSGAVIAHVMLAIAMRLSHGYVAGFHQTYAVMPFVTGMAYFITGGSFWKFNIMWGLLWWVLGVVSVTLVAQPWAPLVYITFSCCCTTHLVIEQLRLDRERRNGRQPASRVTIAKS